MKTKTNILKYLNKRDFSRCANPSPGDLHKRSRFMNQQHVSDVKLNSSHVSWEVKTSMFVGAFLVIALSKQQTNGSKEKMFSGK